MFHQLLYSKINRLTNSTSPKNPSNEQTEKNNVLFQITIRHSPYLDQDKASTNKADQSNMTRKMKTMLIVQFSDLRLPLKIKEIHSRMIFLLNPFPEILFSNICIVYIIYYFLIYLNAYSYVPLCIPGLINLD